MARDTTHITNAAKDFDGYAVTLRDVALNLNLTDISSWTSTSADTYRRALHDVASHVTTLAKGCDDVAAALRAHATAVGNSDAADALGVVGQGIDYCRRLATDPLPVIVAAFEDPTFRMQGSIDPSGGWER